MIRKISWLCCLAAVVAVLASWGLTDGGLQARAATTAPPSLYAEAAVLIEQNSGKVLYKQNMDQQLYPASTTKIMTALLVLENMPLDEKITLPDDFYNVGETGLALKPGATQTVEELLMALMLRSANDAAQALAIGVAGSEQAFVQMMNDKAAELGLQHTHFMNPHGLHNAEHYSSAHDLAVIAREALDNEEFRRIITTEKFKIENLNGEEDFTVYNRNGLLKQYGSADGVKTGYTRQAGNCFVGSATEDGMQLIAVVLNSTEIYDDSQALLEWGFDNFSPSLILEANSVKASVPVLNGGRDDVEVLSEKPLYLISEDGEQVNLTETLDLPSSVSAPVHRGEVIGSITYTDDSGNTYSTNLLAAKDVGKYSLRLVVRQAFQGVWQVFVVPFT